MKLKAKWETVPEDDLSHRVRGDLVASNDRIALVLRGKGGGAEVYAKRRRGRSCAWSFRRLGPRKRAASLASVRILENNPGAVMLAATFAAIRRQCRFSFSDVPRYGGAGVCSNCVPAREPAKSACSRKLAMWSSRTSLATIWFSLLKRFPGPGCDCRSKTSF